MSTYLTMRSKEKTQFHQWKSLLHYQVGSKGSARRILRRRAAKGKMEAVRTNHDRDGEEGPHFREREGPIPESAN
jgi:hypothetical protein